MFSPESKKIVSAILMKVHPGTHPEEDDGLDECRAIAQDFMQAMEQKDIEGLAMAFKAFSVYLQAQDAEQDTHMGMGQ